jgi:peptidyl-prolyl cis-trans isomerase SurA
MTKEDQLLPTHFVFKKGVSEIYEFNKAFHVIKVNDILPEATKSFEESKGPVISDYQTFFEENWLKELHTKYKVNINQEIFKKVKAQIHN